MARPTWIIDDRTQIVLKQGFLGKSRILVNGEEVAQTSVRRKGTVPFSLPDGRSAEMSINPGFVTGSDIELRVEYLVVLSEREKKEMACLKCGTKAGPADRFCPKCGAEIPGAETQRKIVKLRGARKVIAWTAVMFLAFGIIFSLTRYDKTSDALQKLASYQDSDVFPKLINGKQFTVGELRQQLRMEPLSILITNLVLSVIMTGLYFYARRSPLVGLMAALGIYVSVIVLNAIVDPLTIGQGLVGKILIIGLLVTGIRSALELRKVEA